MNDHTQHSARMPRRQLLSLAGATLALGLTPAWAQAPAAPLGQALDAPLGRVAQQAGSVIAQRNGVTRALHVDAVVYPGERIVTGAGAQILVAFTDGSRLTLGADSALLLDGARLAPGGSLNGWVEILFGIVRVLLRPGERPDGFEIRSRAAVASVRSTEWIVEARGAETDVFVIEGRVAVAGRAGATVLLNPGEGVTVREGEAPPVPNVWGPPRVRAVLARTTLP